ncbi:uncharacterized protein B0H64DRAFT_68705 [Chaetomium fimeti]|uniref:Uncharacterized protein n=1 Tax=Chaetomium fimeti TaxID=1854472 RepID=A0AAE0HKP9_9PEZI|nr:hypothetical protein B0H64DRAFT_68705 [Chaetomium fimeti]
MRRSTTCFKVRTPRPIQGLLRLLLHISGREIDCCEEPHLPPRSTWNLLSRGTWLCMFGGRKIPSASRGKLLVLPWIGGLPGPFEGLFARVLKFGEAPAAALVEVTQLTGRVDSSLTLFIPGLRAHGSVQHTRRASRRSEVRTQMEVFAGSLETARALGS